MDKKEVSRKVILLVGEEHREKVRKIAELLNKNINAVTGEAIDNYYDIIVYSQNEFDKFVKKNPRLSLYSNTLKKSFREPCCPNIYKDIMLLDEKCEGKILFTAFLFDENANKFSEHLNDKTESAVIVIRSSPEGRFDELRDKISDMIDKTDGDGEVSLHNFYDENMNSDKIEIFVFVRYKKESEKNDS